MSSGVHNTEGTLDLSHEPTGPYFVRAVTKDGIIVRKIVKQ